MAFKVQRSRRDDLRDASSLARKAAKFVEPNATVLFDLDDHLDHLYKQLLTLPRGHDSVGDTIGHELLVKYIDKRLPEWPGTSLDIDDYGNLIVTVMCNDYPDTMFTCHIDTVHRNDERVKLKIADTLLLTDGQSPLGADDATGILICLWLITNGIEGVYVFHRGEECGGLGSTYIRRSRPEWLAKFKRAIAFDRAGKHDIITSQGSRCASDRFALALAEQLQLASAQLKFAPAAGVFTDTAIYMDVIPECTNISVGYEMEHTYHEFQDLHYLRELCLALIQVDFGSLPTVREPVDEEDDLSWYSDLDDRDVPKDDDEINNIAYFLRHNDREFAEYLVDQGITADEVEAICRTYFLGKV